MKKKSLLLNLFFSLMKIGLFTFGGGYAMIALLESEFIEKKKWIDKEEFLDMAAIAESTPGPIAINAATYIGYKMAGVAGSAVATLAICIPSFTIIYLISLFFDKFLSIEYVAYAFKGIQVCVLYLILSAGLRMFGNIKKTVFNVAVTVVVITVFILFSLFAVKFSTVYYILICGVVSLAVSFIRSLKNTERSEK